MYMEDIEIWKDIKDYEGLYMISSFGNVKSLGGKIINRGAGKMISKERILKKCINDMGYYVLNIYKNSKIKHIKIHKLVATHFLNHKPNGYKIVIDHIDNNKLNNNVNNLQLISVRENVSKDIDKNKTSSKYIGVHLNKKLNKWKSTIQIHGKLKHLGYFTDEYEAHEAYQKALSNLI